MAGNETLIVVPNALEDTLVLKKFLVRLVEKLDIVLGYRGQDPYITKSSVTSTDNIIAELPANLEEINTTLSTQDESISELEDSLDSLSSSFNTYQQSQNKTKLLGATYYDFNNAAYATLGGLYEFTALGSAIINPPAGAGLVPATTYTVMISSYTTIGGGAVQEAYITSAATKTFHKRAGSTSALLFSLGWF